MAEERIIDDDKDKKYRIRINEDGEEELEVIDLGMDEEQEEAYETGLEIPEFEEDDEPYFEEEFSAQISGAQTASCICEHEPYRRANKSGVFFHGECEGDGVVDFSIRGPFMVSEAGAENIPFGERKFMFAPEIEFSCGSLVVSSSGDYFNPGYVRVGNFPYEVLGKTFSLNAFIPKDLAETDANTTFRYSANASIFFEFHE